MKLNRIRSTTIALALWLLISPTYAAQESALQQTHTDATAGAATVGESTMPPQYNETIRPDLAAKYQFKVDGDFTKASGLPTYEWMPTGAPPRAIVVGIHGLTLHGRRYRVLSRILAINGVGF